MARTAVLRRLVSTAAKAEQSATSDRELLRRFAAEGDQAAFAALVRRHTGLVLGVCRRSLPTETDAEDACQAVFLVLARKAASQRWQVSIANWLYATARKVARDVRLAAARRARREGAAAVPEAVSAIDQITARELLVTLDEELTRLPALYREPLVLCYLEGLTRDEVATWLEVPAGTVKIRLERARKKLGEALVGRGVALGIGLLTLATTSEARASSPKLLESILATVGGSPSASVAALAREVTVNGILTQVRWTVLALAGVAVLGFGFTARSPGAAKPGTGPQADQGKRTAPTPEAKARVISGKVVGADGKPAVADLVLVRSDGTPVPLGKTGIEGRFRVSVPAWGKGAHVVARLGGQGVAYTSVLGSTGDVTLRLTKDNTVRGRVIDTQGKPVAGAVVFPRSLEDFGPKGVEHYLDYTMSKQTFWGRLQGRHNLYLGAYTEFDLPGGPVLSARTGTDGRFEIAGLGADRVVVLRTRAAGLADAEVLVINRDRFDPARVNKAVTETRLRMLPLGMRNAGYEQPLHGPEVTFVVEQEMAIRGVVKDRDTGRPRPRVEVTLGRAGGRLLDHALTATTDRDGQFTFRGCRKHADYTLEIAADVETGYLPIQVEVKDTAGYAPIDVEFACARGVIVTGKMTDKATGKPLAGIVRVVPMQDNPHLKTFPTMDRSAHGVSGLPITCNDGSFRFVTLPGPVLVMAGLQVAQHEVMYKPAKADPKYPNYFNEVVGDGRLVYTTTNGGLEIVHGCWCRVIDLAATESGLTLNVELEPATKKLLRVIGPDGKPVEGCESVGSTSRRKYALNHETDKVEVFDIGPKDQRFVVVGHMAKKLIGAAVVRECDRDPVVELGPGGAVTGQVVGAEGKPIADMSVAVLFDHPAVEDLAEAIRGRCQTVVTGADGTFRIDVLLPGHGFRLRFSKGAKYYGPLPSKAPQHKVEKHGDLLKLGTIIVEPRDNLREN